MSFDFCKFVGVGCAKTVDTNEEGQLQSLYAMNLERWGADKNAWT